MFEEDEHNTFSFLLDESNNVVIEILNKNNDMLYREGMTIDKFFWIVGDIDTFITDVLHLTKDGEHINPKWIKEMVEYSDDETLIHEINSRIKYDDELKKKILDSMKEVD